MRMTISNPEWRRECDAETIRNYWANRGYDVRVWVEFEDHEWRVKSDLINGAPRGSRPESLGNRLMGADQ